MCSVENFFACACVFCDHGERHDVHVIDGAHVLLHVFFPSRRSFLLLQGGGET